MYPFHVMDKNGTDTYFNICNMNADAPLSYSEQLTNFMRLESSFLSEVWQLPHLAYIVLVDLQLSSNASSI